MSGSLIPFPDIHPTELTCTSGHSSGAPHPVGVHPQIDHPYSSALSHRSGARKNSGIWELDRVSLCYERAKEEEKTGKGPVTQGGTGENFIKIGNEMVWGPRKRTCKIPLTLASAQSSADIIRPWNHQGPRLCCSSIETSN